MNCEKVLKRTRGLLSYLSLLRNEAYIALASSLDETRKESVQCSVEKLIETCTLTKLSLSGNDVINITYLGNYVVRNCTRFRNVWKEK